MPNTFIIDINTKCTLCRILVKSRVLEVSMPAAVLIVLVVDVYCQLGGL
jgi:hypothetical protein